MIPRCLHFVWCGDNPVPDDRKENPKKWKVLNPDYHVWEWRDDTIEHFLLSNYPWYAKVFRALRKPVKKSDLFRLIALYHFGGVYLDYDLIPCRSVDSFFSDKHLYHQRKQGDVKEIDFGRYELILTREYQWIDNGGHGIANGVILSAPENPTLWKFLRHYHLHGYRKVLDYLGPWAFTKFLRSNKPNKTLVLPPHYFLHERYALGEPTRITVAEHPADNTWGDTTRKDWWLT